MRHLDPEPEVVPAQLRASLDTSTAGTQPEWANSPPVQHPDWAQHAVMLLVNAEILPTDCRGKKVVLNLWVDCGGISTESIASRELKMAIEAATGCEIEFRLYCLCDKDRHARRFVCQNFRPVHTSPDMSNRDFESGMFFCDKCNENHKMPEEGIDIYIGTYPCSPWSPKGPRTGMAHKDISCLHIGLRTVDFLKPWLWLYETSDGVGHTPAGADESHIDQVNKLIQELVSVPYHYLEMRGVQPRAWGGYPSRRPRFFGLRWRADMYNLPLETLIHPYTTLAPHPMQSDHTYMTFLGLNVGGPNLSEVGQFYFGPGCGHPECKCGVDPMELCSVHLCTCQKCKRRPSLACKWRTQMDAHILDKMPQLLQNRHAEGQRLTYMHALEQQGFKTPKPPRVRNMLNVFAVLPGRTNLSQTDMLVDTAPTLALSTSRIDGDAQTITQGSKLWCMRAGKYLDAARKSALMGIKLEELNVQGLTEAWWHTKLGLAMHVAEAGSMLLLLLAAPVGHRLRATP